MTIATLETQAQIWMILVTLAVALSSAAWKLTFYRLLLCSSLG